VTKRELYRRRETATAIRVSDLERYGAWWLADGEMRQLSPETLKHRRITLGCLAWWLRDQEHESLGEDELRAFGAYLAGPAPDGGRWGRKASRGMLRPGSVATYQAYLRSLLDFLEEEGVAEGEVYAVRSGTAWLVDDLQIGFAELEVSYVPPSEPFTPSSYEYARSAQDGE